MVKPDTAPTTQTLMEKSMFHYSTTLAIESTWKLDLE